MWRKSIKVILMNEEIEGKMSILVCQTRLILWMTQEKLWRYTILMDEPSFDISIRRVSLHVRWLAKKTLLYHQTCSVLSRIASITYHWIIWERVVKAFSASHNDAAYTIACIWYIKVNTTIAMQTIGFNPTYNHIAGMIQKESNLEISGGNAEEFLIQLVSSNLPKCIALRTMGKTHQSKTSEIARARGVLIMLYWDIVLLLTRASWLKKNDQWRNTYCICCYIAIVNYNEHKV